MREKEFEKARKKLSKVSDKGIRNYYKGYKRWTPKWYKNDAKTWLYYNTFFINDWRLIEYHPIHDLHQ